MTPEEAKAYAVECVLSGKAPITSAEGQQWSKINGAGFVVEAGHLLRPWSGVRPETGTLAEQLAGGHPKFKCGICGRRLKVGDTARWLFTNGMPEPGCGGNPFICAKCDGPDVKARWAAKCAKKKRR